MSTWGRTAPESEEPADERGQRTSRGLGQGPSPTRWATAPSCCSPTPGWPRPAGGGRPDSGDRIQAVGAGSLGPLPAAPRRPAVTTGAGSTSAATCCSPPATARPLRRRRLHRGPAARPGGTRRPRPPGHRGRAHLTRLRGHRPAHPRPDRRPARPRPAGGGAHRPPGPARPGRPAGRRHATPALAGRAGADGRAQFREALKLRRHRRRPAAARSSTPTRWVHRCPAGGRPGGGLPGRPAHHRPGPHPTRPYQRGAGTTAPRVVLGPCSALPAGGVAVLAGAGIRGLSCRERRLPRPGGPADRPRTVPGNGVDRGPSLAAGSGGLRDLANPVGRADPLEAAWRPPGCSAPRPRTTR